MKFTYPAFNNVIIPLLLSMVATVESVDEYVIVPLLALAGYANAENGEAPYVRLVLTVNAERTGVALLTTRDAVTLPVL